MVRLLLVLAALVLGALGVRGLFTADPSSGIDFVIAGVELIGAIVLIGLAFIIGRDPEAMPAAAPDGDDRAEVIERLQRHTEALRRAAEQKPMPSAPPAHPQAADVLPAPPPTDPGSSSAPTEPDAESAGRFDVRLPALMLLNVGASASAADIESAPPLGSRDDVLARLRDIVPDLEIDVRGRAQHAGPDHAISLDLGHGADVHTVVVEAAGRTGISLVRWFLESTGWQAFVPKLGRFIEPDALDQVAIRKE